MIPGLCKDPDPEEVDRAKNEQGSSVQFQKRHHTIRKVAIFHESLLVSSHFQGGFMRLGIQKPALAASALPRPHLRLSSGALSLLPSRNLRRLLAISQLLNP